MIIDSLQSSGIEALPRRTAGIVQLLATQLERKYVAGSKLPPVRELAEHLGVARATAHRAVQAMVEQGLLVSHPRQGTFVAQKLDRGQLSTLRGFAPGGGRGVLCGKSITFGHMHRQVVGQRRIMADLLAQAMASYGGTPGRTDVLPADDAYRTNPQDDVIVLIQPTAHTKIIAQPHQCVLVLTANVEPIVTGTSRIDMVSVDQHYGGALAGEALRNAGCKDVCFIGRGEPPAFLEVDRLGTQRLAGVEQALGKTIASTHRLLSYGYSPLTGGVTFGKYMKLAQRPDGIFAASDDIALGFVSAAISHGLRMGKDFQLVGFDAQESVNRLLPGGLASIALPLETMASAAAQIIQQRMRLPDMPATRLYQAGHFVQGQSLHA